MGVSGGKRIVYEGETIVHPTYKHLTKIVIEKCNEKNFCELLHSGIFV